MCSVTLKPEQTVPAVRVRAVPNNSEKISQDFFQAAACTLLIFGFRGLFLTFVGKGAAQGLQMQEGSEEKGQRLDQYKGSLLVT